MQLIEVKYKEESNSPWKKDAQALLTCADSLEQLFNEWLKISTHEIRIHQATSDSPGVDPLCLILAVEEDEIAEIYLDKNVLRMKYPALVPIGNLITTIGDTPELDDETIEFESQLLEEYEEQLGFEYNNAVCQLLGPMKALVPCVLPYALSEGGSVVIQNAGNSCIIHEQDVIEELEQDGIRAENLLCIMIEYESSKVVGGMRSGFGTCVYIRTDSNSCTSDCFALSSGD